MKAVADEIYAKGDGEETRYADALRKISMAYSEIPAFIRNDETLEFCVEGKYSVTMYRFLRDVWVSSLVLSDGRDSAEIDFAVDSIADYRKLSLAASKAVEEARRLRPGLEWVLTHTDEFIEAMMDYLEKEYC